MYVTAEVMFRTMFSLLFIISKKYAVAEYKRKAIADDAQPFVSTPKYVLMNSVVAVLAPACSMFDCKKYPVTHQTMVHKRTMTGSVNLPAIIFVCSLFFLTGRILYLYGNICL